MYIGGQKIQTAKLTVKDVDNGELNRSLGQKLHKTLLNDSLAFWLETFLQPSKKDSFARRLKIGVTSFTIASDSGCLTGLYVDAPLVISLW